MSVIRFRYKPERARPTQELFIIFNVDYPTMAPKCWEKTGLMEKEVVFHSQIITNSNLQNIPLFNPWTRHPVDLFAELAVFYVMWIRIFLNDNVCPKPGTVVLYRGNNSQIIFLNRFVGFLCLLQARKFRNVHWKHCQNLLQCWDAMLWAS